VGNKVQDFYFLFVTREIFQMIVDETNRYAIRNLAKIKTIRLDKWKSINKNEIKRFFGLLIWMSLMKLFKISSYWCTNKTYSQSFPKTVISKNRFELFLQFLHFNNDEETDKNDKLCKIDNKVVDALDQNFQTHYELDEDMC